MWFTPGRKVTVSLVDGTALTGRTKLAWPGRLKLVEVQTAMGEAPGAIFVYSRSILTVQVMT